MLRYERYLVPSLILLAPFGVLSLGTIHEAQYRFFLVAVIVATSLIIADKILKAFIWYIACWLVFIYFLAMLYPTTSARGAVTTATITVWMILLGLIFYQAVYMSRTKFSTYAGFICLAALAESFLGICQKFWLDLFILGMGLFVPISTTSGLLATSPTGTLGNNNFWGAYLAISAPFFLRGRWRWGLPVILYAIVISETKGAFIPAIIGLAWYYYDWFRMTDIKTSHRAMILGALLSAIFLYYALEAHGGFGSFLGRWQDWTGILAPVFSSLPGVIFGLGPAAVWDPIRLMHSDYVAMLFQFGLIGLILMVVFLGRYLFSPRNKILRAALLIAALNMMANHPIHLAPSALLIITVCALLGREHKRQVPSREIGRGLADEIKAGK